MVQCACDSTAAGFPSQKLRLMFSFMFALTSCLNNRVASELKSQDAYAMPLLSCYVSFVNPTFGMVEHQDNYVAVVLAV